VLRACFPGSIETHSLVQDFFFGEDLMLRRHDYTVNIAGGFAASQLTFGYGIAIRAAIDQGVTFFDTAEIYGRCIDEDLVGERSNQCVIAARAGPAVPTLSPHSSVATFTVEQNRHSQ